MANLTEAFQFLDEHMRAVLHQLYVLCILVSYRTRNRKNVCERDISKGTIASQRGTEGVLSWHCPFMIGFTNMLQNSCKVPI